METFTKQEVLDYYKNKRVLITGHTGFKGSWLTKILTDAGANVIGYSLEPPTRQNLFDIIKLNERCTSIIADIRDFEKLMEVFDHYKPEIVFHLAAQPLVRQSYEQPRITYETNVMGTVNVCEAIRQHDSVKSFINVTTDKVYKNNEWCWGYRENEPLDGFDPYSNSKSCSELVTHSYLNSFFKPNYEKGGCVVSTVRAGNVIGGGDFATDRIIPDCVRSVVNNERLIIRNPYSIRPYQHVLEPLFLYLNIAARQFYNHELSGYYNVGPDECDCISTGKLVSMFEHYWKEAGSNNTFMMQFQDDNNAPHEATFLKLDTGLVKRTFDWKPNWHIEKAVKEVVDWTMEWLRDDSSANMNMVIEKQIKEFVENGNN